jgi:hypothetical protein
MSGILDLLHAELVIVGGVAIILGAVWLIRSIGRELDRNLAGHDGRDT